MSLSGPGWPNSSAPSCSSSREPAKTLLLERTPRWSHLLAMVGLALVLHPVVVAGANQITKIYPVPEATEQIAESIGSALDGAPHWLVALALMALLPGLCQRQAAAAR